MKYTFPQQFNNSVTDCDFAKFMVFPKADFAKDSLVTCCRMIQIYPAIMHFRLSALRIIREYWDLPRGTQSVPISRQNDLWNCQLHDDIVLHRSFSLICCETYTTSVILFFLIERLDGKARSNYHLKVRLIN